MATIATKPVATPRVVMPSETAGRKWVYVASGELRARADRVIVRPLPKPTTTRSGLLISPTAEYDVKECLGWVTSVGPDRDDLVPGNVVLFRPFSGTEIQVGDQQRVVLPGDALLAVIEP